MYGSNEYEMPEMVKEVFSRLQELAALERQLRAIRGQEPDRYSNIQAIVAELGSAVAGTGTRLQQRSTRRAQPGVD
jgi:hypothetical protein